MSFLLLKTIHVSCAAISFTLFFLRSLDDNRLTSWRWVFSAQDALAFALVLALAVLFSYAAAFAGSFAGTRLLRRVTMRSIRALVGVMLALVALALGTGLV